MSLMSLHFDAELYIYRNGITVTRGYTVSRPMHAYIHYKWFVVDASGKKNIYIYIIKKPLTFNLLSPLMS